MSTLRSRHVLEHIDTSTNERERSDLLDCWLP